MKFLSAIIVIIIKYVTLCLYRVQVKWITPSNKISWEELRIVAVLNHTSLFEFLFVAALPNLRLYRATKRIVLPVADVTMNRPLVGSLFKILVPNAVSITRKRDETWDLFMHRVHNGAIAVLFPEGRMKRKDGLDKHGKPMSVKGGIADIIEGLPNGKMLIAYSAGLHHVQAPGDIIPRIFKRICISFEQVDVVEYKKRLQEGASGDFRTAVIADLETRMKSHC